MLIIDVASVIFDAKYWCDINAIETTTPMSHQFWHQKTPTSHQNLTDWAVYYQTIFFCKIKLCSYKKINITWYLLSTDFINLFECNNNSNKSFRIKK